MADANRDWVLGLGSNLGSREALIETAIALLDAHPQIAVRASAHVWETDPIGPAQPRYLNTGIHVETDLAPDALLAVTRATERALGRVRRERWGPRTLDIDLLFWRGGEIAVDDLVVPHPELIRRPFALAPVVELFPDAVLPDGREAHRVLSALGPIATRPPWRRGEPHAVDAVDALAVRTLGAVRQPAVAREVVAVEATRDERAWVEACERTAEGMRVAHVVVFEVGEARITGALVGSAAMGERHNID